MLRLNLKRDPYWIDLPAEVRLFVRPLSTAIMSAAQAKVIKEIIALREKQKDVESDTCQLDNNEETRLGLSESLLIKALAKNAILQWEGVLALDSDSTAPITDKNVEDLMDIWFIAQDFWKQYTNARSQLECEGNSSGLGLNGISAAGPVTAKLAKRKISTAVGARRVH